MPENPIVDAHFRLWMRDHPLTDTAWHAPPTDASTEELIATHDRHGLIFGVVAAASIHGNTGITSAARLRRTAVSAPRQSSPRAPTFTVWSG